MMEISIARCHPEAQGISISNILRTTGRENTQKLPCNVASPNSRWGFHRFSTSYQIFTTVYPRKPFFCRTHSMQTSLEESASLPSRDNSREDLDPYTDSAEETLTQPLTGEQALARLAEEIAQSGIPEGSRKINGKYIHSHLVARLEAVHEQLKEQIMGVDAAQSKEVSLFWVGMAESVQIMGSFDGWSQGEHLSPEYNGSYTRFSTTLMLRPGRYEIKFLVDGEWLLSPEFPVTGEGLTKNNLLIVECAFTLLTREHRDVFIPPMLPCSRVYPPPLPSTHASPLVYNATTGTSAKCYDATLRCSGARGIGHRHVDDRYWLYGYGG